MNKIIIMVMKILGLSNHLSPFWVCCTAFLAFVPRPANRKFRPTFSFDFFFTFSGESHVCPPAIQQQDTSKSRQSLLFKPIDSELEKIFSFWSVGLKGIFIWRVIASVPPKLAACPTVCLFGGGHVIPTWQHFTHTDGSQCNPDPRH